MYFGLCYSIAEMSPALPHTGGAYSFARSAMGPWGGFVTGVAENIEYVVTPAVVVVGIGGYMNSIFDDLFGVHARRSRVVGDLLRDLRRSEHRRRRRQFRFTVFICVLSLAILAVFFVGAIPNLDFSGWAIDTERRPLVPPSASPGVFFALPFAIWFYLAIEELPLAAEESADPKRDIPRGTIWGSSRSSSPAPHPLPQHRHQPGRAAIGDIGRAAARRPQDDLRLGHLGLAARPGRGRGPGGQLPHDHLRLRPQHLLAVARRLLPTLAVGHPRHAARRRTSRSSSAPSSAGSPPTSSTSKQRQPGRRVAAVHGGLRRGDLLLHAVLSFILLRRRLPNIERPYRSPVGEWGAAIAGVIALCSLGAILYNADYRPGVYGVPVVYLVALAYFAAAGPPPARALARGGIRDDPRASRPPRIRGLRHDKRRRNPRRGGEPAEPPAPPEPPAAPSAA